MLENVTSGDTVRAATAGIHEELGAISSKAIVYRTFSIPESSTVGY